MATAENQTSPTSEVLRHAKFKTPYAALVPPLSTMEFDVLKADIKANGVRIPVEIDDDGNILDGHHRNMCAPNAPYRVIKGLSEPEKRAYVIKANVTRRNLSPSQKTELQKAQRSICAELHRTGDHTQRQLALLLGVSQQTVSDWIRSNTGAGKASKRAAPDCRVKVAPAHKAIIAQRVEAGETQSQVAADYGVSQRTISSITTAEKKTAAVKQEREASADKIKTDCGVIHGDFRRGDVPDESVGMIFTDPPYDDESIPLYGDLAKFAARVLIPGGWCLAYSGILNLDRILPLMAVDGLKYGWTFCITHNGGDSRFRKFKLQNGWKPILGFYKPPLSVGWNWFPDMASGGKEKDAHPWQQAVGEARHFISHLAPKGSLVCDPFSGSGTSLFAAKRLGLRWVGFEINEDHVMSARIRLNDSAKDPAGQFLAEM
jgi:DNA-binding XRE family transcriptional regulator